METVAVVLEQPGKLALRTVALQEPKADDLVVDAVWSGISSGTERLLWAGRMPSFPGMGYPLVPGYETVARVSQAAEGFAEGDLVFVPGANCYKDVKGLFGGAAKRIVLPAARAVKLDGIADEEGILIALAATAHHAVVGHLPQLIIGHGLLGRLIARITLALGGAAPTVIETQAARHDGAAGYTVITPDEDQRRDYAAISMPRVPRACSTGSSRSFQSRAKSRSPASTRNPCPSPSRPPSCARPASASRPSSPWPTCRP